MSNKVVVPCNGMVVVSDGQALVADTPTNSQASRSLIHWLENTQKVKINGVISSHFHVDCLGGLSAFHDKKIPSYASLKTIEFVDTSTFSVPQIGFDTQIELPIGRKKLVVKFLGEGHTKDNVVCYYPKEKILFGGCLIKSLGAGKGNLSDAMITEWSNSVGKIKEEYSELQFVIPGHGKHGGIELLDYTIQLFND